MDPSLGEGLMDPSLHPVVSAGRGLLTKAVLIPSHCQTHVCCSLCSAGAVAGCGTWKSIHGSQPLERLHINSVPLPLNSANLH